MKKKVLIIVSVLLGIILIIAALASWAVYQNRKCTGFIKNTTINGVDCSDLNPEDAEKKLIKEWNHKKYTIYYVPAAKKTDAENQLTNKQTANKQSENDQLSNSQSVNDQSKRKILGVIKNFDFKYDIMKQLQTALKFNQWLGVLSYYGILKNDITITMNVKKESKSFIDQIKKLKLPSTSNGKKVETRDAYIDMSNTRFEIVPEVYGNTVSKLQLNNNIVEDIENSIFEMDYKEEDCYLKPRVKKDDPQLLKKQENCKKYLVMKVAIDFVYRKMKLTPKQLSEMMNITDEGAEVVEKKVLDFVTANATAAEWKYLEYSGKPGRALRREKLKNDLIALLKTGKDGTVKAKYTTGRVAPGTGNTYVEIDISKQHLWYVIKGKKLVDTPIVSGNVAMNDDTPTGLFKVFYMERNAVLRGNNDDGTRYESPVQYWMPFNGGIGMHDASWKSVYGGTEYLNNGSHGCINMPLEAAKKTFNNISVGTYVLVHP